MNSDFLKYKFTSEIKINALKQLKEEGSNGINSYQQMFIITCSRDKLIRLFLAHSGEQLHTFVGHDNWVRSLAIHPTGKYLYSASDDKSIRIWDLNYGKEKKKIDAHDHFISTVKFNKKYWLVSSAGNDMVIKIWALK